MTPIYQAASITDAHLLKQLLEQQGIAAHIAGEYLQGAVGELPANTPITLMVADDDAIRARNVVDDWVQSAPAEDGVAIEHDQQLSAMSSARKSHSIFSMLAMLMFGGVIGAGLSWVALRTPHRETVVDYDGDGVFDEHRFYAGDLIKRAEIDRNHDGKPDEVEYFDSRGQFDYVETDDDFDGRREVIHRYAHRLHSETTIDADFDGHPDARVEYLMGVVFRQEFFNKTGHVVKRVMYEKDLPKSDEFDSDGDGKLDVSRRYGAYAEIVSSEPIAK